MNYLLIPLTTVDHTSVEAFQGEIGYQLYHIYIGIMVSGFRRSTSEWQLSRAQTTGSNPGGTRMGGKRISYKMDNRCCLHSKHQGAKSHQRLVKMAPEKMQICCGIVVFVWLWLGFPSTKRRRRIWLTNSMVIKLNLLQLTVTWTQLAVMTL